MLLPDLAANHNIVSALIELKDGGKLVRYDSKEDLSGMRSVRPGTYVIASEHLPVPILVESNQFDTL